MTGQNMAANVKKVWRSLIMPSVPHLASKVESVSHANPLLCYLLQAIHVFYCLGISNQDLRLIYKNKCVLFCLDLNQHIMF